MELELENSFTPGLEFEPSARFNLNSPHRNNAKFACPNCDEYMDDAHRVHPQDLFTEDEDDNMSCVSSAEVESTSPESESDQEPTEGFDFDNAVRELSKRLWELRDEQFHPQQYPYREYDGTRLDEMMATVHELQRLALSPIAKRADLGGGVEGVMVLG